MSRHTPGPWDAVEDPRGRLVHVETRHDNPAGAGLPVCSIPTKRMGDAVLIAAAPDLLEALSLLAEIVRTIREEPISDGIFTSGSIDERRERSRIYADRIRAEANKIGDALDLADAALSRATS